MSEKKEGKKGKGESKPNRFVLDDTTGITIGGMPLEEYVKKNQHLLKKPAGKSDKK